MMTFNLFTFFNEDLIQSEVSWKLSSASDWITTARKNVNLLKWSHFWDPCCNTSGN